MAGPLGKVISEGGRQDTRGAEEEGMERRDRPSGRVRRVREGLWLQIPRVNRLASLNKYVLIGNGTGCASPAGRQMAATS